MIQVLAFDADDTLWHNERHYKAAQELLENLLAPYAPPSQVQETLLKHEHNNIPMYGYGVKGFILSMIETMLDLSDETIPAADIRKILARARHMLSVEVELVPHVREVLEALSNTYDLLVITKGDLLDQRSKMARSGLNGIIPTIEVVSEKTPAAYLDVLNHHNIAPEAFMMVGNSLRSDILPVLEIGAEAVYIPSELTWDHEKIEVSHHDGYHQLETIRELPALLETLAAKR